MERQARSRPAVYSTKRDAIESLLKSFRPGAMNFNRKLQNARRLPEKRRLLVLGFGQRDPDLRPAQRNRDSGKAGARPEIQ